MSTFKNLGNIEEIDKYIYQNEDVFSWNKKQIEDVQFRLIREAFEYHYNNCSEYRDYCICSQIYPCSIKVYTDLANIPLVPSTIFKKMDLMSVSEDSIIKKCTSSGTTGALSIVNRDEITLNRFLGSVEETIDQMFHFDDALFLNLGPSTEESKDLWFSYVMSITDLVFPSLNFVEEGIFYPEKVIEALKTFENKYETLAIIGAPIMFMRLLEYMSKTNQSVDFGRKVFIITAGGWKKFSGEAISKSELYSRLKERIVGLEESSIRDALNMVELNSIWPECASKVKHVPPWVKVIIRSPYNLEPLKNGEMGLISFLDPTATSYPAFILTMDFGKIVVDGECECGCTGTGIEIIRRVKKGESRGCALKMDKVYN